MLKNAVFVGLVAACGRPGGEELPHATVRVRSVVKPSATPTPPGTDKVATTVGGRYLSVGYRHTCALLDTGAVKCWGQGEGGQLGLGDTKDRGAEPNEMGDALPPVDLGTGRRAVAVSAGGARTCAVLDTGAVKCWGSIDCGPVPTVVGDALPAVDLSGRTAVAVSAGGLHTCAILDTGAVTCWGHGEDGQLGLRDKNEVGDALPAVALGKGSRAVAVSAGGLHTCAILDTGVVKCWGSDDDRLGRGTKKSRGGAPNEIPAVDLGKGSRAVAVSAGGFHTCALLATGAVKCWGQNQQGQLGLGDGKDRGGGPKGMGGALPAVDLGTGSRAIAISAGFRHTCAVLDTGAVKCWGEGMFGRLGLGAGENRGDGPNEMGDSLPAVDLGAGRTALAVSAGALHTCALLATGAVKCWGEGADGKLGLGDTKARGDEPNEMGDALPAVDLGGLVAR